MAKQGRNFNDRELASQVRSLALNEMKYLFELEDLTDEEKDMKKQLLLRMSTSLLPRLNELTGLDGEKLEVIVPIPVADTFNIKSE